MMKNSITTVVLENDKYETWFENRKAVMAFIVDKYGDPNLKNYRIRISIEKEELTDEEVSYFGSLEGDNE